MIHGCVSTCDCVVHVNRLPPDDGKHQRKIFRTRVCVSTLNESDRRLLMSIKPLWPLCTQAETCMKHCTLISKSRSKRLVGFLLTFIRTLLILPKKVKSLEISMQRCKCFKIYMILIPRNVKKTKKKMRKKTFSVRQ